MRKIIYPNQADQKYLDSLGFDDTFLRNIQPTWELLRDDIIINNKNQKNASSVYKHDFKDIIIAPYEDLLEIYLDWDENNYSKNAKINSAAENLFNYSSKKNEIADFFMLDEFENITTCFYCETAYINIFKADRKKRRLFDVDHFLPNKQSPITAISLYNFVPSCIVCNRSIKGRRLFNNLYKLKKLTKDEKRKVLLHISPTCDQYDYDNNVKISIKTNAKFNGPIDITKAYKQVDIDFKSTKEYDIVNYAFKIKERYNYVNHKKYALMCWDLVQRYTDSNIHDMAILLNVDEKQLKEDIFHEDNSNKAQLLFGKMRKDLFGW